jgi:hypothetical protein
LPVAEFYAELSSTRMFGPTLSREDRVNLSPGHQGAKSNYVADVAIHSGTPIEADCDTWSTSHRSGLGHADVNPTPKKCSNSVAS